MTFRIATDDDRELLFKYVNEPAKMERLKRGPLTWEQFCEDFERKRGRSFLWMDDPLRQVRGGVLLELRRYQGEGYLGIPWSVFPEYRGRGCGKAMVAEAVRAFPGPKLARIDPANVPSIRCAITAGYNYLEMLDGMLIMEWRPK